MTASERYIVLHGAGTSIILETVDAGAPLWRYWGVRLPEGTLPPGPIGAARPTPSFSLDIDRPFSIFPGYGVGWFGAAALAAHRDGRGFAQDFTTRAIAWTTPGSGVAITLEDRAAQVEIDVRLDLDPATDVLSASAALTNRGESPLVVDWLAAAALPLPREAARVRYYTGRHNREFVECEDALGAAAWRRDNRRGLTSHDCFPGGVALADGATRDAGLAFGAQLAWSGSHAQFIERLDDGRRQWQFGVLPAPGEEILAAGARLETPPLLATLSPKGANGVAQNFHAAIRKRMVWPGGAMAPRKTHINSWEAFYFDHRPDALLKFADDAAALGIERFVLDDGWFRGRNGDRAGLGDWTVDAAKYPQGLGPLIAHVRALGMEFGLWVEPEMVNPDSDLYRAHPEWALRVDGAPPPTARNQLVLDLSRADVREYLFGALDALLGAHPIGYLKWDHNRDLTAAGMADGRAAYRRQTQGAYALFERLRRAHPMVEIEACAGGGGRIDAGIIQYTHRFWTSDCLDAIERLSIQRGFLQFFPPEIMGSHIGAAPSHATSRTQKLDFRAAVALPGHFGVELDPAALSAAERARLAEWIAFYKSVRDIVHRGRVWQGECGDGVYFAAHGTSDEALIVVWRAAPTVERHAPVLRLAVADPARRYRVRRAGAPGDFHPAGGAFFAALAGDGIEVDGAWLAVAGLPLPPMPAETALFLRMVAI